MIAPAKLEAQFTNQYGERFVLRVDPTRRRGELLGDETDWKPIEIADDTVQGDFLFSDEEWGWVSAAWQQFTGRPLQAPTFSRFQELLQQMGSDWPVAPGVPI